MSRRRIGQRSLRPARMMVATCAALGASLALGTPALAQDFEEPATSPEPAGDGPNSVAAADLDGDSKLDLATANVDSDDLTILLGDGTGDFTPATTSPEPAGNAPRSVAAADLDGDDDIDLAVANASSDDVTILLGVEPTPATGRCQGARATIIGTNGPDTIRGTTGRDVIDAGAGNDVVSGRGGNDLICGKDGDDTLYGQGGDDDLYGGAGTDECRGGDGRDTTSFCELFTQ